MATISSVKRALIDAISTKVETTNPTAGDLATLAAALQTLAHTPTRRESEPKEKL